MPLPNLLILANAEDFQALESQRKYNMEWYAKMNARPGAKTTVSVVSGNRGHELLDELDELQKELLEQIDIREVASKQ